MTACCSSAASVATWSHCAATKDCCWWIRARRHARDQLQAELAKFARGAKVHTVLNTHWHAPQTGGNDVFGAAGARIIAHARAAQRMAVDQYVPAEERYIKARNKVAVPKEVFYDGSRQLPFGKEHIEYGYLQQAHTDGDIYVFLRESNVLLVGDCRVAAAGSGPGLVRGWLAGRARGFTDEAHGHRQCADEASLRPPAA